MSAILQEGEISHSEREQEEIVYVDSERIVDALSHRARDLNKDDINIIKAWADDFADEFRAEHIDVHENMNTLVTDAFVTWIQEKKKIDVLSSAQKVRFAIAIGKYKDSREVDNALKEQLALTGQDFNGGTRAEGASSESADKDIEEQSLTGHSDNEGQLTNDSIWARARAKIAMEKIATERPLEQEDELTENDLEEVAKVVLDDSTSVDKDYANETAPTKPEPAATEQEKIKRKEMVNSDNVYSAERAVIDFAQEIGQLRTEIAQTDGELAEHEEKIKNLIERLDVSVKTFGNYGEETQQLRTKLEDLHVRMKRLQERADKAKASDSFGEAYRRAMQSGAKNFIFGDNAYVRVGDKYILDPGAHGVEEEGDNVHAESSGQEEIQNDILAQSNKEESTHIANMSQEAQDAEQSAKKVVEGEQEELKGIMAQKRSIYIDAHKKGDAATEKRAFDDYVQARDAYIDQSTEGESLEIRAIRMKDERQALVKGMQEAAGNDDPMTNTDVRRAYKIASHAQKEAKNVKKVLGLRGSLHLEIPVPEQFIKDGRAMTSEEIYHYLKEQMDNVSRELDQKLRADAVAPRVAKRFGMRLLERFSRGVRATEKEEELQGQEGANIKKSAQDAEKTLQNKEASLQNSEVSLQRDERSPQENKAPFDSDTHNKSIETKANALTLSEMRDEMEELDLEKKKTLTNDVESSMILLRQMMHMSNDDLSIPLIKMKNLQNAEAQKAFEQYVRESQDRFGVRAHYTDPQFTGMTIGEYMRLVERAKIYQDEYI